jgi:hypothetical protein
MRRPLAWAVVLVLNTSVSEAANKKLYGCIELQDQLPSLKQ